jgi:DNA-binding transcriptional ArsR family regulator
MNAQPNLAPIASLIGSPARALILSELLGGYVLTATELATRARVALSTASEHLAKLVSAGLLSLETQGRHRYYLLGSEIASLLETLGVHSPPSSLAVTSDHETLHGIRFARTCYDHLAGHLGVGFRSAFIERELLVDVGMEHRVTTKGESWLVAFGVDLQAARRTRRSFARRCLDSSERRPHLAGALGAALLDPMFEADWIVRVPIERLVKLTPIGEHGLGELGVQIQQ